jgi:hypothetical protein
VLQLEHFNCLSGVLVLAIVESDPPDLAWDSPRLIFENIVEILRSELF